MMISPFEMKKETEIELDQRVNSYNAIQNESQRVDAVSWFVFIKRCKSVLEWLKVVNKEKNNSKIKDVIHGFGILVKKYDWLLRENEKLEVEKEAYKSAIFDYKSDQTIINHLQDSLRFQAKKNLELSSRIIELENQLKNRN